MQSYGWGVKGHCMHECTKTSAKKKEEILAIVKSGDFKTSKSGVANTNVKK